MTIQRTMSAPPRQQTTSSSSGGEGGSSGGSLLEQAQGFAQVAREAVQDCQRGTDAAKELLRRRNQSGQ